MEWGRLIRFIFISLHWFHGTIPAEFDTNIYLMIIQTKYIFIVVLAIVDRTANCLNGDLTRHWQKSTFCFSFTTRCMTIIVIYM